MKKIIGFFVFIALIMSLGITQPVRAASWTVNSLNDPGDGVCDASECTLREAIASAASGDVIDFGITGTIHLVSQISISKNLTITGPGADQLSISGDTDSNGSGDVPLFNITNVTVSISDLTLEKGYSPTSGGAMVSKSALTITRVVFTNNSAVTSGGAIYTSYHGLTTTIQDSTFLNNSATNGGAVYNYSPFVFSNSTFSGNVASASGGGVYAMGLLTVNNSTFTGNSANTSGAGIYNRIGTLHLKNSILANNLISADCHDAGSYAPDTTGNLIKNNAASPADCGTPAVTSDPTLGSLEFGGGSYYYPLLDSSPAINTGDNASCAAYDQRGVARPQGGTCDIGSYEFYEMNPPSVSITSHPSDPTNITSADFSFTASDDSGSPSIQCDLDGTVTDPCSSPMSYGALTEGLHTFTVTAKDIYNNSASDNFSWFVDLTSPSVTIEQAGTQPDPTNQSPIHFTASFTEPVTGFGNGDVSLSGSAAPTTVSVTEIAPSNGTTYDIAVSGMSPTGTVIASIDAGVAFDVAGNGNTASASIDHSVMYDAKPPSVIKINSVADTGNGEITEGEITGAGITQLLVVFTEDIVPPAATDFQLSNSSGSIAIDSVVYNSASYTATLNINGGAALPVGTYTLTIKDTIKDLIGNAMSADFFRLFRIKGTLTFYSTAVNDGWILESGENTSIGGSMNNASNNLIVGDDAADRQYRSIVSFNTSSLNDNSVIVSAKLNLNRSAIAGTNPLNTHGRLQVDIRLPYFGTSVGLVINDFQAAASQLSAAFVDPVPSGLVCTATFPPGSFTYISLTTTTQLRLRFALDDNDDLGADTISFFSGNYATTTSRPRLIIEYYLP